MPCCGGDAENQNASDEEYYGKLIIIGNNKLYL